MYIRTPELSSWLGDTPTVKYKKPFDTGGVYVSDGDAAKLLSVISGPSPYQSYIKQVLASKSLSALPKKFLRVVSSEKEVPEHLRDRFVVSNNKRVGGTIDRKTGTIYMLELPGVRGYTRVEFALHEIVHLLAHPGLTLVDENTFQTNYGPACIHLNDVGTFQRKYCSGFGEGGTQAITEQIMKYQDIDKFYGDRPYDDFTPPVYKLIDIFTVDRFARAYFWGEIKAFTMAMELRWGNAWRNVVNFTAAGQKDLALKEIEKLENESLRKKGDFPAPSPYIRSLV
jgi:hypothetical protein